MDSAVKSPISPMFANLTQADKEAFFSLLDECVSFCHLIVLYLYGRSALPFQVFRNPRRGGRGGRS